MKFYLRDTRTNLGSTAMFWRDGGGYTSNLKEAEKFTVERAQSQHDCRITDVPLLCSEVDRLTKSAVDMQYLPDPEVIRSDCLYVCQIPHKYNGNDICFVSKDGRETFILSEAKTFSGAELMATSIYWPLDQLELIATSVLDVSLIDKSKMMVGITPHKLPPKPRHSNRCFYCGCFISEEQQYTECPKCGEDNRP